MKNTNDVKKTPSCHSVRGQRTNPASDDDGNELSNGMPKPRIKQNKATKTPYI